MTNTLSPLSSPECPRILEIYYMVQFKILQGLNLKCVSPSIKIKSFLIPFLSYDEDFSTSLLPLVTPSDSSFSVSLSPSLSVLTPHSFSFRFFRSSFVNQSLHYTASLQFFYSCLRSCPLHRQSFRSPFLWSGTSFTLHSLTQNPHPVKKFFKLRQDGPSPTSLS